jgi:primosomal protein N' (replication factor Y)
MASIALVQPMTTARALRGPFDYRIPDELSRHGVGVGSMLVVPFGRRELLGVVVGLSDRSDVAEEKLLAPLRALELGVPVELVALAEWIAREYCSTFARALALVLPPGAARRLSGRRRGARNSAEHVPLGGTGPDAPELTGEQRAALDPVLAALQEARHERRLVHGVTGSGKTELYLRAAAAALERGRGAIVLVPEIALTPQIVTRFVERFGETVAVLHSRLTAAQRYEQWRRLREGTAQVCVGPRSAVFAPVSRLGLLVVDEEHDAAYKHEGDPRYDAREVAAERARDANAVLLLGSATPRPETALRARTSVIARRPDGRALPPVRILDMREVSAGLHPETEHALARVRSEGGKAIVFSTGAAGRTSSRAARAGTCGAARTATSRWCCTAPAASSRATTAGIARRLRRAAASAPRRRSRGTGRGPSVSRTTSPTCSTTERSPCSVSTRT